MRKQTTFLLALILSLSSCTHDFLSSEENSVNEEEMETKSGSTNMEPVSGIIVLGERMTNPYSIEIMQEAGRFSFAGRSGNTCSN